MKRFIPITIWLGALSLIACVLLCFESDLLWKVQQQNLFLCSSLFFKQMMVTSGGMLSYLGTFFTQFFYHPWIGVVMLCGWWWLLMWLVKRAFQIPDRWMLLTLIPVGFLLIANTSLDYWIYILKLKGYFFSATIGTTVGVTLLWLFRILPHNIWLRMGLVVLTVATGYPLMGAYALATALLMGIWTWRLTNVRKENICVSAIALLSIIVIPLACYRYVYYQTHISDIYLTALPVFTETETLYAYYIPYYLLALYFLIMAVVRLNPTKPIKPIKPILLQALLLVALIACIWHFWYKDDNYHHELRMQRCIEQADWQGVIDEGKKQEGEPTRAIVMMHNLALSRLGLQCDMMYSFPKGSKKPNTPLHVFMYNTAGRLIYYHYGMMNECHRICMEEGVEYGWSVERLQYMARNALFNNEARATMKFLNLLRQTCYYGDWADHFEGLINRPDLMASDMETGPITHMMHYPDVQSAGDGFIEKNLMEVLSKTDANEPYFQEQAVLAAMWTRNTADFWARFEHYVNMHPNRPVPRIFQEAAYLFGSMENLSFTEELPVDRDVKENLHGFIQVMQQCNWKPNAQVRNYLYQRYGTTYYFEFFFLKDITYF